jgi:hypothetical protein
VPVKWIDRVLEIALKSQPQPLAEEDGQPGKTGAAEVPARPGEVVKH